MYEYAHWALLMAKVPTLNFTICNHNNYNQNNHTILQFILFILLPCCTLLSRIYLSYSWKFITFDHLHPFHSLRPLASGSHQSVICIYEFIFVFVFRFHVYMRLYSVYLCLTYFTQHQSLFMLLQMAGLPSFQSWIIFHSVHIHLFLFSYPSMDA